MKEKAVATIFWDSDVTIPPGIAAHTVPTGAAELSCCLLAF